MAIGGDVLIKLAADVAELRQGFEQARREARRTGDEISGINKKLEAAFGTAIISRVVNSLIAMGKVVGDIGEQASSLQLTTNEFQGIADAAVQGGLGVEGFTAAFNKLNKEIGSAFEGNKASIERFQELGVKLIDTQGNLRGTADVAAELAVKLQNLDQPNQRAAKTMEFFGKSGAAVLPVMAQLEQGADALAASLARRGGIASPDTIEKLDKFFDTIESSKRVLQVQGGTIFANFIPEKLGVLDEFERLGRLLTEISEKPIVKKGLAGALDFLTFKAAVKVINDAIEFATQFGDTWEKAANVADLAVAGWVLRFVTNLNNVTTAAGKAAEGFVNVFIEALNAFVTRVASELPDWAKQMLGITGGPIEIIKPITIDFKAVGVETVLDATVAVQAAQDRFEQIRKLQGQAAAEAAETAARLGKLPQVNPPGAGDPKVKTTGKAPRDRVQEMLDELAGRQRAEEKALAALQGAAVDRPLKEIERAVELQKKIDETIAKVASKETGGASPELVKRITEQVTATETATRATKDYQEALKAAHDAETQFGDGNVALTERMIELNDALATGRLSWEAYAAAVKDAKEKQDDQALSAERAKGGMDAFTAGFTKAAKDYAKANDAFALGGQLFDGTINLMTQGLQEFAQTGEIQFDKLLAAFAAMLAEMALKAAASAVFSAVFAGLGGGGFTGLDFAGVSGGGFAGGSTNDLIPGVAYTVGEFGRETFIPRVAGQVMTADDMSASSRGPNVSQTINVTTGVQQTVRAEIASMLPMIANAGAEQARNQRQRGGKFKSSFAR